MSAGDALGSCAHRGEPGHLPHPDGRPCIVNGEADRRQPVPGVYSADQGAADREELRTRDAVEAALRSHDESMEDRLARLRHVRRQRDDALRELAEVRDSYQRACETVAAMHAAATGRPGDGPARGVVEDVEDVRRERDALVARLASECRAHNVTAELVESQAHRLEAYDDLQRKAEQGMALELAGRVYVQRDLLVAGVQHGMDVARDTAAPAPFAGSELLEANGGLFVPIPEGHMLSVTVTPYDATPEDTTG